MKNMGSGAAPLSFVEENEAVNYILQVVAEMKLLLASLTIS